MDVSRTLKLMFRWALFGALLSGIFWTVWTLIGADVPVADPLRFPGGRTYRFDAIASRALDPLGVAGLAMLAALGVSIGARLQAWKPDVFIGFCVSAAWGLAIGGGGYYAWASLEKDAAAAPFVFLVLACVVGLVMGILCVAGILSSRAALVTALLAPVTFCVSATGVAGIGEGYLHALVSLGILGVIGTTFSSLLCLVTLAVLKNGFWSWFILSRPAKMAREAVDPSPEIVGQSPAARLDEIAKQIASLETERTSLMAHPDSARL